MGHEFAGYLLPAHNHISLIPMFKHPIHQISIGACEKRFSCMKSLSVFDRVMFSICSQTVPRIEIFVEKSAAISCSRHGAGASRILTACRRF